MTYTSRIADQRLPVAQQPAADQLALPENRGATDTRSREEEQQREIRLLTHLLRQEEQRTADSAALLGWFAQVHRCLASQPRRWLLLPATARRKLRNRRLKRAGLFDSDGYLKRYPDVATGGLDPLDHYMRHGVHEGRIAGFESEFVRRD